MQVSKQYGYKDLIEAYIATKRLYVHADFTNYYNDLFKTLADVFGIHFRREELTHDPLYIPDGVRKVLESRQVSYPARDYLMIFDATIFSYLAITHPWRDFLESHRGTTAIADAYGSKLFQLEAEYKQAHLDLLDVLFKMMYGEMITGVTSEQLLEGGFDTSKEPQIWNY